jgi:hypothetical protein
MALLPITKSNITVNATAATTWSWTSPPPSGRHFMIKLKNTGSANINQQISNVATNGWDAKNRTSVLITPGSYVELSCWVIDGLYTVIIREP